jgi:hypothetical protein
MTRDNGNHVTRWALLCSDCGSVPLTKAEYIDQMDDWASGWVCSRCRKPAEWDDSCFETNSHDATLKEG